MQKTRMKSQILIQQPAATANSKQLAGCSPLLTCFEDSSFIYCQGSLSGLSQGSSRQMKSAKRRNAGGSSSSRDSMISTTNSSSSSSSSSSSCSLSPFSISTNNNNTLHRYNHSAISSSPSCISALDYCHLSSSCSSYYARRQINKQPELPLDRVNQSPPPQEPANNLSNQTPDPVYLNNDEVFSNLIMKESVELSWRQRMIEFAKVGKSQMNQKPLTGQLRHSLLSWMLNVCEHQSCQDEIFPLATMILDKFLLLHYNSSSTISSLQDKQTKQQVKRSWPTMKRKKSRKKRVTSEMKQVNDEFECCEEEEQDSSEEVDEVEDLEEDVDQMSGANEADQIQLRQLYLFAGSCLLLATKLRQTPRLHVQTLTDFSSSELPIELNRDELLDAELLVLVTLKWDLASLVTPNDFLEVLLMGKCNFLMESAATEQRQEVDQCNQLNEDNKTTISGLADHIASSSYKIAVTQKQSTTTKHDTTEQQIDTDDIMMNTSSKRCEESRVRRHTQTLLELCLMDPKLSQYAPSVLAMASMAVAIDGLSMTEKSNWRLEQLVTKIHESTHGVNELKLMIDVAFQIETYVQKLLNSTQDD